jgi:hypothetical protein
MYGSSDTARVTEQNTRPALMEPSLRCLVSAPLYRKNSAIETGSQTDRMPDSRRKSKRLCTGLHCLMRALKKKEKEKEKEQTEEIFI